MVESFSSLTKTNISTLIANKKHTGFFFVKMFRTFVQKALKNFGQSLQIVFPSCATNKLN